MDCWPLEVQVEPLTKAAFTPYGQVISSSDQESFKPANQGSAKRFDFVANLCNKRYALVSYHFLAAVKLCSSCCCIVSGCRGI